MTVHYYWYVVYTAFGFLFEIYKKKMEQAFCFSLKESIIESISFKAIWAAFLADFFDILFSSKSTTISCF